MLFIFLSLMFSLTLEEESIGFDVTKVQIMDCDRYVKDDYFYASCEVYARAFESESYQSIKVTCHLRSLEKIKPEDKFIPLKILEGRIEKSFQPPDNYTQTLKYRIPYEFYFALGILKTFDVSIRCTNETAVGIVYRMECNLKSPELNSLKPKLIEDVTKIKDISECFGPVKLTNSIVIPFPNKQEYYYPTSHSSFKGFEAIVSYKELWFNDFGCVADRIEINLILKTFPFVMLSFFHDMPVLSLILNGNNLQNVSYFPNIPLLNTLMLSSCSISYIHSNSFQGLSNLKTLDLSYNQLQSVPSAIMYLPHLQNLYLQFNKLKFTDAMIVPWPSSLRTLNLSGNPIQANYFFALNETKELEHLALNNCNISEISSSTFPSIQLLRSLDLSGNSLITISITVFRHFPFLQTLDLSNNNLKSFDSRSEEDLRYLLALNLSGNLLTDQSSLTLDFNGKSLQSLDLSRNQISEWNSSFFRGLSQIQRLDLSSNNITELNQIMRQSLNISSTLRLKNNPFDCDSCDLRNLQEWLQEKQTHLTDEPDTYICRLPIKKFGLALMKTKLNNDKCLVLGLDLKVILPVVTIIILCIALGSIIYYYRGYISHFRIYANSKFRKLSNSFENEIPYRYDAYISYTDEDEQWLGDYLIPEMENSEPFLKFFIRDRNFLVGLEKLDAIADIIDNCRKCIFILSHNFLKDSFRNYELELAIRKLKENNHDFVLVIRLEPIKTSELPKAFQQLMTFRTYLDWPQDPHNEEAKRRFWNKLTEAVAGRNIFSH